MGFLFLLVSYRISATNDPSVDRPDATIISQDGVPTTHSYDNYETDRRNLYHVIFDFAGPAPALSSQALLKSIVAANEPTKVGAIRVVGFPYDETFQGDWKLLEKVFDHLSGLERVDWEASKAIPKKILRSLEENNPDCHLHYTAPFTKLNPEKSIIGSKVLYSLKAQIVYQADPNLEDLDLVFNALGSCPNLKELDLSIDHQGCVLSDGQPWAFDFLSKPDIKFAPLEKLTIDGYHFDQKPDAGYYWQNLPGGPRGSDPSWYWSHLPQAIMYYLKRYRFGSSLAGLKRELWPAVDPVETSLDWWLKVMDWSSLHSLDLKSPMEVTLTKLDAKTVPALRNLTLSGGWRSKPGQAALSFVSTTARPLEGLSLQNMEFESLASVVETISKHQKQLQTLAIHQAEDNWGTDHHLMSLNTTEVSKILHSCPKLQKLDIDMERSSDWDAEFMRAIFSSAPDLSHFVLHFPSPDAFLGRMDYSDMVGGFRSRLNWEDMPDPVINKTSIDALFKTLRQKKRGNELENLDVYVGNWEDRNLPATMMGRTQRRIAWYSCYVWERKEICIGQQTRNDT